MQYGDLEKYIHIISDNKHIIQTKIKKNKTKTNDHQFYYLPTTHFLVYDIKALRILSLKCPFKLMGLSWQRKDLLVYLYEEVWCTDRCAWFGELAVRLKCAIKVTYDSEELGSCCENHRTHLTNGLHILSSFFFLFFFFLSSTDTRQMCQWPAAVNLLKLQCHRLAHQCESYDWAYFQCYSQNKSKKALVSKKHYDAMQREIITIPL